MRRRRCRFKRTATAAALPVLVFAFCAEIAWRNLDDLVLVPIRARVPADGGADLWTLFAHVIACCELGY